MKKLIVVLVSIYSVFTSNLMAQVPNYVPTNGLVGWYPFNGNANDESGNANNGTVNGATLTTDRFGNVGKAYSFDGIDDYIQIIYNLSLTSKVGTISTWIKSNGNINNDQRLIYGQGQGRPCLVVNQANNRKARLQWHQQLNGSPFGWAMVTSTSNIDNSQWINIVGVYDTSNLSIYINGILEATYSSSYNQWNCSQYNFHIGAFNATSIACGGSLGISQAFNGNIDDIGAWNRTLTQDEITKLFKSDLKNCPLISSVTLNAQSKQSTVINTAVNYLPNSNIIIADTSQWNYIALTKSGLTGKLFINGVLVTNDSFENKPYIWNSILLGATQGCVSCAPVPNFKGLIDEVRVSNIARSAQSISSYFASNMPFTTDLNTIGLFKLDTINSGNVINNLGGTATTYGLPKLSSGKFGKALEFNGSTDYVRWSNSIPVNNMTIEFWIKSTDQSATIAMLEYAYNTGIHLSSSVKSNPILWSTGDTSSSITVDPSQHSHIWVTDGYCKDSIWFNSNQIRVLDTCITKINDTVKITKYDTVKITKYDTVKITKYDTIKITKYDTIKVTDTLVINATLSGVSAPNNTNRLIIYPNPAKDHITIDYGVFSRMNGYTLKIVNTLGQIVFSTPINQQTSYINLSTWTGKGMYYVQIYDASNTLTENRKIVLQ